MMRVPWPSMVMLGLCACGGEQLPAGPSDPDVPSPATVQIQSVPDTLTFIGAKTTLRAVVMDETGSPISGVGVQWRSLDTSVAAVDASGTVTAIAVGTGAVEASAGGVADTVPVTVIQVPASVRVDPGVDTLTYVGDSSVLVATVLDAGGFPIPDPALTWTSSDEGIIDVSSQGVATARSAGTATVGASMAAVTGSATLVVVQTPAALELPAGPLRLPVGAEVDVVAQILDGGGSPVPTASATWSSRNAAIASITTTGRARGVAPGRVWLVASAGALTDSVDAIVDQTLKTITISPGSSVLNALGDTAAFTAVGLDAGGQEIPGTLVAEWSVSDPSTATSLGSGRFRALRNGSTTVLARVGGLASSATLVVQQRAATVDVTSPLDTFTALGETARASATATDRRGNAMASGAATWRSSAPSVIAVDPSQGLMTAVGAGEAWIVGSVDNAADSVRLWVEQIPASVQIDGGDLRMTPGTSRTLTGRVADSRGSAIEGATLTWSSSAAAVAAVDNQGKVTANTLGEAWIAAASAGLRDSVRVTVDTTALAYEGNLTLASQADVEAVKAAGYTSVRGTLRIGSGVADTRGLESIREVTKDVRIDNTPLADLAGLSGLETVGGTLYVTWNDRLTTLAGLSALDSIGGAALIIGNRGATGDWLPAALRVVVGKLDVGINGGDGVRLPSLERVLGDALIGSMGSIEMPALRCVARRLVINHSPSLQTVSLPVLETVGTCGGGNYSGTSLEIVAPALTRLSLPSLRRVLRGFRLQAGELKSLDLRSLAETEVLSITAPLESLDLSSLPSDLTIRLEGTRLESLSLPNYVSGTLWLERNQDLKNVELPNYTGVVSGSTIITGNGSLTTLDLPALMQADILHVQDNASLTSFTTADGASFLNVEIRNNPLLATISRIRGVVRKLVVVSNPALQSLDFLTALTSGISWYVQVEGNALLTDISALNTLGDDAGADPVIAGDFSVLNNPLLTNARAQALLDLLEAKYPGSAVGGRVTISGNGG